MVRNIVVFAGTSHPQLTDTICGQLGIPPSKILLSKFAVGETRVEVGESVRGKDVFIIQSGGGKVNDHVMELLITISACKTASARRVTAVLPLFPYSRQSDLPYNKAGAPLARLPAKVGGGETRYTFDSLPATPHPGQQESQGLNNSGSSHLHKRLNGLSIHGTKASSDIMQSDPAAVKSGSPSLDEVPPPPTSNSHTNPSPATPSGLFEFKPQRGYKQWVAQAGTLIADLLTCAGADHVITMDLHDPQYQGFFDIPVDNLYGRHLLRKYILHQILPTHGGTENCVVVSPDAGGAKRATNIADSLGMDFALIHKVRRIIE